MRTITRWPFFQSTLDLIEMVLAKADARIAAEYDRRLVPAHLQVIGGDLRSRLRRAMVGILAVTGHRHLVETNPVLRRSIDVRNPYVDPINLYRSGADAMRQAQDVRKCARVRGPSAWLQGCGIPGN